MLAMFEALSDFLVLLMRLVDRYEGNSFVCAQIARLEGLIRGVLLGIVSLSFVFFSLLS